MNIETKDIILLVMQEMTRREIEITKQAKINCKKTVIIVLILSCMFAYIFRNGIDIFPSETQTNIEAKQGTAFFVGGNVGDINNGENNDNKKDIVDQKQKAQNATAAKK